MPSDSYGEILRSLFGDDLASFLDRCDRRHPDLKNGAISSFLDDADEIIRAYRFCFSEGLEAPSKLIAHSSPKFFPGLLSKTRVLKEKHRIEARRRKASSEIDLGKFSKEARRLGADLPESFGLYSSVEKASEQREKWGSIASRFESIGCGLMAKTAADFSVDYEPTSHGLFRLSIRRASLILCKKGGVDDSSGRRLCVGPVNLEAVSEECRAAVENSDKIMDGFPFFDHHVLVSLHSNRTPKGSSTFEYVVLGERDGECYFLFSD